MRSVGWILRTNGTVDLGLRAFVHESSGRMIAQRRGALGRDPNLRSFRLPKPIGAVECAALQYSHRAWSDCWR